MKKTRLKFAVLLLSGFSFVACDKDDEVKPSTNEPEFPTSFSKLTVEQNKAKLESNKYLLEMDRLTCYQLYNP